MDPATRGIRLHLRQTTLRSPSRRPRPAGPRTFPGRLSLSEQIGTLPGEPRRAARGCYLRNGNSSSCSNSYLSVSRIAVLSRGPIPGAPQAHFSASLSPPLRACRPAVGAILRPPACPVASTDRPGRALATTRVPARLGRKLDLGLCCGICLARRGGSAPVSDGEL